ncbi:DUF2628 domain-containing protein [Mycobacterium sp. ITM-2016-00317]|uniref:DUF2628 domain-containing protein n=1 Tax=Mycobacterium sp. ITM-2016-00317 TaxID=2099694 RepID=UPI00287F50DF|nr:DUF2628 domain-containing protein [Mycobacterium sp. ITM-2016-00317]WNG86663.1 DUF2628 domain-containing protein [Mycobacterium sp. ITM-2016-00317]
MGGYDVWQLSESWRIRFAYFETYGSVWSTPEGKQAYRALSAWDRVCISWNVLAFLFGPAYFLAKGMWRKGVTLLLVACALSAAVLAVDPGAALVRAVVLIVPVPVLAMATANYAYYLHVVEGSRSWNPWEGRLGRR